MEQAEETAMSGFSEKGSVTNAGRNYILSMTYILPEHLIFLLKISFCLSKYNGKLIFKT
jgi:hypothetical protein